jgi:hypothetical protein
VHHNYFIAILEVAFVAIFVIGGVFAALRRQDERQLRVFKMQELAGKLGFESYDPGPDPTFVLGWGFLDLFSRGENRYVFNRLEGTYQDQKLFVFDYHYQTDSSKDRKDYNSTLFMLIVKECFPKITIARQNFLLKIEARFDSENIQFESAEFSKTFRVLCVDKKFAYDVCNPQMMEFLLANRDLQIEIQGPVISLAFTPQLSVGLIEFNLQRLAQIRSLLPQYLFTNK